jgi:hypothetical protein
MKIIICKKLEFGEMWTCQYKCQLHLMLYLNLNETHDRPVFSELEEKNFSKANFVGFYPPESGLGRTIIFMTTSISQELFII